MDINKTTPELMKKAEEMQEEMHSVIEQIKNYQPNPNQEYQDLANTYLLLKIADLSNGLENLRNEIRELTADLKYRKHE